MKETSYTATITDEMLQELWDLKLAVYADETTVRVIGPADAVRKSRQIVQPSPADKPAEDPEEDGDEE